MKSIIPDLKAEDKNIMEQTVAAGQVPRKQAVRPQAVSRGAAGKTAGRTAESAGINRPKASTTVSRYNRGGLAGLTGKKTRKPRIRPAGVEIKNAAREAACKEKPEDATRWSTRAPAKKSGLGKSAVNNILREREIKPRLTRQSGFSGDIRFAEKLTDAAGLYMNPPDNAIAPRADEKSQIQAPERGAPPLPLREHIPARQSAGYYRRGTATLFAAPDTLAGNVRGERAGGHKSTDFTAFLKKPDKDCGRGKAPRIIPDNYPARKPAETKKYPEKKPERFALHFIPARSPRLNMTGRWFAEITDKRIRRDSWEPVEQLVEAVKSFIARRNREGRAFKRTKPADEISGKTGRSKAHYNIP